MQHVLLKSKIHRACVTVADVEYEGSIEIPSDLMEEAGLWEGERVLVTSASKGGRLETYAQAAGVLERVGETAGAVWAE